MLSVALPFKLKVALLFCLSPPLLASPLSHPTLQSAPNIIENVGGTGKAGASTFGATGENDGILIFGAPGVLGTPGAALGLG